MASRLSSLRRERAALTIISIRRLLIQQVAAIRASEAQFRHFAAHSSNLIWIGDPRAGTTLDRSVACETIYGAPIEEAASNLTRWMKHFLLKSDSTLPSVHANQHSNETAFHEDEKAFVIWAACLEDDPWRGRTLPRPGDIRLTIEPRRIIAEMLPYRLRTELPQHSHEKRLGQLIDLFRKPFTGGVVVRLIGLVPGVYALVKLEESTLNIWGQGGPPGLIVGMTRHSSCSVDRLTLVSTR